MVDRNTVLVLGANGLLGAAAVQAFAGAGWDVVAQTRRPLQVAAPAVRSTGEAGPGGPGEIRPLPCPLEQVDRIVGEAGARRIGVVVHAINPPYTQWPALLLPSATCGMDIAMRLEARFMLPGNVYNFGAAMPPVLAVDTPQQPTTRKGRLRCELEAQMRARARDGLHSVVIRAGDFFGPDARTWLDLAIAKSMRAGRLAYPGPLDVPHAWAYLPDLARAFVAVAKVKALAPFTVLHFEGHTLTGRQLLDALVASAKAQRLAPAAGFKESGFPWPLLRIGGLVVPMWREVAEMAYLMSVPHRLDGSALRRLVGDLPQTALADALAPFVRSRFG